MNGVEVPNRTLFRPAEVCQIAGIQPYVLRTWEAEFPDLGVARRDGRPRVYRRADVERVLAIKQLVFEEGLTLAGARRRLGERVESPGPEEPALADLLARDVRERLQRVREGLQEVLQWLARPAGGGAGTIRDVTAPTEIETSRRRRAPARSSPSTARRERRETARGKGVARRARR